MLFSTCSWRDRINLGLQLKFWLLLLLLLLWAIALVRLCFLCYSTILRVHDNIYSIERSLKYLLLIRSFDIFLIELNWIEIAQWALFLRGLPGRLQGLPPDLQLYKILSLLIILFMLSIKIDVLVIWFAWSLEATCLRSPHLCNHLPLWWSSAEVQLSFVGERLGKFYSSM